MSIPNIIVSITVECPTKEAATFLGQDLLICGFDPKDVAKAADDDRKVLINARTRTLPNVFDAVRGLLLDDFPSVSIHIQRV